MIRHARLAVLAASLAVAASSPALAWGPEGHRLVGAVGAASFPAEVPEFLRTPQAVADIGELAREPDRSKGSGRIHDSTRDPGHFLDVDVDGKVLGGPDMMALPNTRAEYETALRAAGTDTYKAGYLYYSLVDGWQQLVKDFTYWRVLKAVSVSEKDPKKKAYYIADLRRREAQTLIDLGVWAHYVGDGSQPLHLSNHFNGWDSGPGPNPNGYTNDRKTHSRFEDEFVAANVTEGGVKAKVGDYTPCMPIESCTAAYLQTTWKTVIPFYELEKAGGFAPADARGKAFATDRVAAGAAELRNLVVDAWRASAKGSLGYPAISVDDLVSGKADAWGPLYGVN